MRRLTSKVFGALCVAAVTLEAAITEPFRALASIGKLDLAEVCCTRESRLTQLVQEAGGKAERYSIWNGFDLSTEGGTNRLIAELKR